MNRTTKVAVALIVAAGLSTMALPKQRAGAVSLTTQEVIGPFTNVPAGAGALLVAVCPQETAVTGGGWVALGPISPFSESQADSHQGNAWGVEVNNKGTVVLGAQATAECVTINP